MNAPTYLGYSPDPINQIADQAIQAIETARTQALEAIVQQQHDLLNANPNLTDPVVVAGIEWGAFLTPSERGEEEAKFNEETGLWYFSQRSAVLHAYEQNLRLPIQKGFQQLHDRTTHRNETIGSMPYKVFTDKDTGKEVWFPFAGWYDFEDEEFNSVTTLGYGWSSSVYSATDGLHLSFNSSWVYPQNYNSRSYGFPVRCVASVP